ncbi:hypothetical protein Tco_1027164 [Tanacetum coccineum]
MQTEEQEQLSIEEKSKLFVELLEKRKKHFAALKAQEKRNKPPTKAQNKNTMSTYLQNMAGYKHNQLKSKSYDEIQEMFDKEMKKGNTFLIPVSAADPVTTASEVVTTASVEIPEKMTLAQTLIEIKSAKPKAVTTVATTVTPASSSPKAKGIVFHDQEEQAPVSTLIISPSQLP